MQGHTADKQWYVQDTNQSSKCYIMLFLFIIVPSGLCLEVQYLKCQAQYKGISWLNKWADDHHWLVLARSS